MRKNITIASTGGKIDKDDLKLAVEGVFEQAQNILKRPLLYVIKDLDEAELDTDITITVMVSTQKSVDFTVEDIFHLSEAIDNIVALLDKNQ